MRCYNCGEAGHLKRQCRKAQVVKTSNGKSSSSDTSPPGVKSFNVEVAVANENKYSALESTTEGSSNVGAYFMELESAMCGVIPGEDFDFEAEIEPELHSEAEGSTCIGSGEAISFEEATSSLYEPFNGNHSERLLGNPLCELVEHQLEKMRPYPGDPSWEGKILNRFTVYATNGGRDIVIMDDVTCEDEVLEIGTLFRPDFLLGRWFAIKRTQATRVRVKPLKRWHKKTKFSHLWAKNAAWKLNTGRSFRKYLDLSHSAREKRTTRFDIHWRDETESYLLFDFNLGLIFEASPLDFENSQCDVGNWYYKKLMKKLKEMYFSVLEDLPSYGLDGLFSSKKPEGEGDGENDDFIEILAENDEFIETCIEYDDFVDFLVDSYSSNEEDDFSNEENESVHEFVELNNQEIETEVLPAAQRNAARVKDPSRVVPNPVVVVVNVNGQPARALIDTGSLCDFMSTTLADQLRAKKIELSTPLMVQLAVLGSRSKVNYQAEVNFTYQGIKERRNFDIINLSSYDLILGTLYQHSVMVGFNPTRMLIGSNEALPIKGAMVKTVASRTAQLREENLEDVRRFLREQAEPLCRMAAETELPPLRAINHRIDLIDENKIYPWRASRCPEAFQNQWIDKRDAYIRTGRWEVTNARNSVPIMFIPKPAKPGETPKLRTVMDLRPRNANTKKMSSPLPDIDGIMRRVASKKYRSVLDLKDAYEQVRIEPSDVWKTAFATPNGNMVSHVIQIGDCNAPATYQALMNHIFSPYIGKFMDVYLDDIVIYSDTLEEHIQHVLTILDVLRREKFYLSAGKLDFLSKRVKILGRIVDDDGIQMDPHKVDALIRWKVPTNRELLRGFLGAAGYLADDIAQGRIPMGVLHTLTSESVPFRWDFTHQRAFEEVKALASKCRNHHRRPIDHSEGAPPINLITDGCATGIAGVISQGHDWKTAPVAAFYSAKLSPAQQNYPVHEIEMLAGLETMMRYQDILLGMKFRWFTDHKGLITLLNHRDLSGRRARWLEKLGMFNFEVVYIPGSENILSDALSRIYSNDAPGTVRAPGEYTEHDEQENPSASLHGVIDLIAAPVLVGMEAECASMNINFVGRKSKRVQEREGAETRRPETSDEFAARVKDMFTLKGPEKLAIRIPKRTPDGRLVPEKESANNSTSPMTVNEDEIDTMEFPPLNLTADLDGIDVLKAIKGRYKDDPLFKPIVEKPKEYKNFEYDETGGLLYLKQETRRLLCIPNVKVANRSIREIVISEGHSVLAHLSFKKTYDYLHEYSWATMGINWY
ncbi:hypothetical protein NLJ89_g3978 [Agrocybe chaxingu]|uniref:RNA-directed DNA polymerase n=1 Tax=Agrocybe chaxingu TaxID=84603 RepID=A0A9W8MWD1_9AGAR|nr:hypothetical protein NLJ89_g3978 [Agrocybe chaxingu]